MNITVTMTEAEFEQFKRFRAAETPTQEFHTFTNSDTEEQKRVLDMLTWNSFTGKIRTRQLNVLRERFETPAKIAGLTVIELIKLRDMGRKSVSDVRKAFMDVCNGLHVFGDRNA